MVVIKSNEEEEIKPLYPNKFRFAYHLESIYVYMYFIVLAPFEHFLNCTTLFSYIRLFVHIVKFELIDGF
jgi:hypothetical protein